MRHANGFVKCSRERWDTELGCDPLLLGVYHSLEMMAQWKPSRRVVNGKLRDLPAGSVVFGISELAQKWGMPRTSVFRLIHKLEEYGWITLESGTQGCLATIRNWDENQYDVASAETPVEHGWNTGGTRADTHEERKKERREESAELSVPVGTCDFQSPEPLIEQPKLELTPSAESLSLEVASSRQPDPSPQLAAAPPSKKPSNTRLAALWNENCGPVLPQVRACGKTRLKAIKARWEEHPEEAYWIEVIRRIAASPFCTGKNDRGWRADFDWLLQPEVQNKVLEGKYDAHGAQSVRFKSIEEVLNGTG